MELKKYICGLPKKLNTSLLRFKLKELLMMPPTHLILSFSFSTERHFSGNSFPILVKNIPRTSYTTPIGVHLLHNYKIIVSLPYVISTLLQIPFLTYKSIYLGDFLSSIFHAILWHFSPYTNCYAADMLLGSCWQPMVSAQRILHLSDGQHILLEFPLKPAPTMRPLAERLNGHLAARCEKSCSNFMPTARHTQLHLGFIPMCIAKSIGIKSPNINRGTLVCSSL